MSGHIGTEAGLARGNEIDTGGEKPDFILAVLPEIATFGHSWPHIAITSFSDGDAFDPAKADSEPRVAVNLPH